MAINRGRWSRKLERPAQGCSDLDPGPGRTPGGEGPGKRSTEDNKIGSQIAGENVGRVTYKLQHEPVSFPAITMLAAPRPILKRPSSSQSAPKHAHFPPPAMLTCTYVVHSSATYDRSPIVVAPNVCALPERGGRTYVLDDAQSHIRIPSRAPWHPSRLSDPSMPALIPDLSSESDESDAFPSPHLENQEFNFIAPNQHGLKAVHDDSLSFLPYSPSNPYCSPIKEDAQVEKTKRRRERKNDASRDRNRIRTDDSTSRRKPLSSSTPSRPHSSHSSPPSFSCDSFSSFALSDDSCLGGF